jgi:hypothetical protein
MVIHPMKIESGMLDDCIAELDIRPALFIAERTHQEMFGQSC